MVLLLRKPWKKTVQNFDCTFHAILLKLRHSIQAGHRGRITIHLNPLYLPSLSPFKKTEFRTAKGRQAALEYEGMLPNYRNPVISCFFYI